MNLDIAIKERYSCRTYKSKELAESQICEILNAAHHAPSPKNRQPWRFVVLRQKDKDNFLKKICNPFSNNSTQYLYEKKLNEFNSEKETYRIMKEADSVILVFNAYPSNEVLGKEDKLFDCANIQAIGAAIQNMILKATDLGIGSLWICDIFACYQQVCEDYYKEGQLIAAIALGHPADINVKTTRKPLDELIIKCQEPEADNLIWVGPRESDIYDCSDFFQGSVTIFGSNCNGNISYCKKNSVRIDHNIPGCIDNSFWIDGLKELKEKYPDSKILYYNSEYAYNVTNDLKKDVICCNELSLIKMLNDKSTMRMAFSDLVPVVPFQELTYSDNLDLSSLFSNKSVLIFQENNASGGYGTHVVNIATNCLKQFNGKTFMVSPYIENSVSVNAHIMIGHNTILYFPESIQIISNLNNKLIYLGADYISFQSLSVTKRNRLRCYVKKLGEYLQNLGYKGILGFDFLITKDEIMFVEVNPRFQASTPLLNKALKVKGLPSIQEMQIAAFMDKDLPTQSGIDAVLVPYSMISYIEGTWNKPYDLLKKIHEINEIDMLYEDGFSQNEAIQKGAYLFKMVFNTNCISVNADYKADIYENLIDTKGNFYKSIMNKNKLETKISLLNQGVIISKQAKKQIENMGKIRNAVFSAVDITIYEALHINCPKNLKFYDFTPWTIDVNNAGNLTLFYYDNEISTVTLDLEDIYCNNLIQSNVKFSDVCFWATDRLRIHHNLSCCMKNQGIGCKFCEVPANSNCISIEDILYVVDFYLEKADTFRHFLIGGGSEPRELEYINILKIVKHIRKKSAKDIYVMSLPPKDISVLKMYYEAGVTEIGFNIEVFDQDTAANYMPGKGRISRQEYLIALKEAVRYWGNTGKVRSLMIIGLESEDSLLQGIRELCQIGVMPILSVFRPIPGTETENIVPPSNHFLKNIYEKATTICEEFSLHLGPECSFCQNNTLSLPF
jgi:nitroreductase